MAVPAQKFALDHSAAQAVISAVQKTFSGMIGLRPNVGQYYITKSPTIMGDISGFISLVQDGREGALIISFPKESIFHILARAYKMEFYALDACVQDGVAEFTNVINGSLKAKLNRPNQVLQYPLPHVIIGDQHKVVMQGNSQSQAIVIPFTIAEYSFTVILQLYDRAVAA